MTVYEGYKYINAQIDNDSYGGSFAPDEYNYVLEAVNLSYFRRKLLEQAKGEVSTEMIYSSDLLRPLVITETITPTTGVVDLVNDLSDTYSAWVGAVTSALYNGQRHDIELVSYDEFHRRVTSLISPPVSYNPVAVIYANTLTVYPTDISSIDLTYLKVPSTPFMDYYQDANYNIQFLVEDATYTLQSDEVYRDGTDTGDVSSITNELDYSEEFHEEFFNEVLDRVALRIGNQMIKQHTEINEQKEDK